MTKEQPCRNQKIRAHEFISPRFGVQPSGCPAPVAGYSLNSEPHSRDAESAEVILRAHASRCSSVLPRRTETKSFPSQRIFGLVVQICVHPWFPSFFWLRAGNSTDLYEMLRRSDNFVGSCPVI